ncbi:15458_t:CDS:2, partial [Racocetra fulgida]
PDGLVTNIEVLCDTNCIEEVFDLLQAHTNDILIYNTDLSNRNFIGIITDNINNLTTQVPKRWISTVSSEINGLTKENQVIAQQHLNQCNSYANNNCRSRDMSVVINNTIQDENTLNNESNSLNEAKSDINEVKKEKVQILVLKIL